MGRLLCGSLLAAAATAFVQDKVPPPAGEDTPPEAPAEAAGKPVLVLDTGGHTAPVNKVLFTPDGKQVLTVGQDRTIRLWDAATGQPLRVLRTPSGDASIGTLGTGALSPDGKVLAVSATGAEEGTGKPIPIIYLIDLADGALRTLRGHTSSIGHLAFSADGQRLASGAGDKTARIWDVAEGKILYTLGGHPGGLNGLAFSPDGGHLVTVCGDTKARIWSLATGKQERTLDSRNLEMRSVAWSGNGKTIVTGGNVQNHVCLWDPNGKQRRSVDVSYWVTALEFKGTRDVAYTWVDNGGRKDQLDFGVGFLDTTSGRARPALVLRERSAPPKIETAVSPDGKLAATTGGDNNQVYLWTMADGKVIHRLEGHGRPVFSVGWGADEEGRTTVAWGVERKPGDHKPPLSASFNFAELALASKPDPKKFQGAVRTLGSMTVERSAEKVLTVKEFGNVLTTLRLPRDPETFTLLPGDKVAVALGGLVLLHDARTGKELHRCYPHRVRVWALAPSPDGRYLASVGADQTVRITNVADGQVLLSLFVSGNEWVAWTPLGYYAASAGGERLMGWQVNNGTDKLASFYPAAQFRASLYRPEAIGGLLEAGNLIKALAAGAREGGAKTAVTRVEEVLPPAVTLAAPALKAGKTATPTVELTATAKGTGKHPVASVQLMLDGRPYQGSGGLHKVEAKPGAAVTEKWTVELPEGEHTLRAVARSEASMGMSEDLEVTYTQPVPRAHLYLLAVGINAYANPALKLGCAVNDARGLEKTFQEHSKGLFDVEAKVLTDQEATRDRILEGLKWLKGNMKARDLAVIFYAGHGEQQGKGFFLLPQDVDVTKLQDTGISGEVLKQHLADLPGKVLLLLDACHSGAIGKVINEMARDLADDDCGVVVMCAALGREKAGEADGHGFFCRALIEALQGRGQKNLRDGCIYQHHLEQYVIDRVQELSKDEQHPTAAKPTLPPFPLARP